MADTKHEMIEVAPDPKSRYHLWRCSCGMWSYFTMVRRDALQDHHAHVRGLRTSPELEKSEYAE